MNRVLKIGILADEVVGLEVVKFLANAFPNHIQCIFLTENSNIHKNILHLNLFNHIIYSSATLYDDSTIKLLKTMQLDYIVLAWWPNIIKKSVIAIPKIGVLNFHPSYLPYNRGKHYNFWTLVEETPFGVTIHFVDEGIDTGDIVFQKKIEKIWEDTGETLYYKAQKTMIKLFIENYPQLINNTYQRIPQNLNEGTFHLASEIDTSSEIILDKLYSGKHLLNLFRARQFPPHPSCYFFYNDLKYNISIKIFKCIENDHNEIRQIFFINKQYKAKNLLLNGINNKVVHKKVLYFIDNNILYSANITISCAGIENKL